jgi:molybdate transport system substrate-binding protein
MARFGGRWAMLALAGMAGPLFAAEVSVLSGGAVKSGYAAAVAAWEKQTGNAVKTTFAPAGEMTRRLGAGERFDLVIMPVENLPALERGGLIAPGSHRPIAAVSIGIAVKKGAPVPDVSTPEAVRRLLVGARSLTYMDPARGTSGKHVDEVVLPKLGVRDEVRAKTTFGEGGMIAEKVARGEVELAIHQYTEILPVEGVTPAGLLPPELQKVTVYAGAVTRNAASPAAAELLAYLASPQARSAFLARGFSAP